MAAVSSEELGLVEAGGDDGDRGVAVDDGGDKRGVGVSVVRRGMSEN
jgi:hypothetical protein